ncbi:flagellin [Alphaproteobacteria bacterium]|nr:flagellin [Alphaproteobacteria bacterium]
MTSIATNRPALRVHYHGGINNVDLTKTIERLSSGKRITNAADDAAGLFVANRITSEIRGLERGIQNAGDALGLVSTAENGLQEIRNMVLRMRELAVQMANGVYNDSPDRGYAQTEIDQLMLQVDMIANNVNFNDVKLLDGSFQNVNIQTSHNADERISLFFKSHTSKGLGIDAVDISTQDSAKAAMVTLNTSLEKISDQLSMAGGFQNRIKHGMSLSGLLVKSSTISLGRIMDADMAEESTNLSKAQVLAKANTAMLAQANQSMASILTLFS